MVGWRKVRIDIHCSNAYQNAQNCLYPHNAVAENAEAFEKLVRNDHVFFDFKDGYRSIKNFLGANVAALDCDNDHSDNGADWLTLRKLTEIFGEVRFVAYTSRNHMKQKGSRSPRPRFHILFPIERISSAEEYAALLKRVQHYLPVFDEKALDAGRFYFGNREAKAYFHEGSMTIKEFLDEEEMWGNVTFHTVPPLNNNGCEPLLELTDKTVQDSQNNAAQPNLGEMIPEGSRNATLSHIAGKLLKRYGNSDGRALDEYRKACDRCEPPLDIKEIETIWKSAEKFYGKIAASENYIPPEEYEKQYNENHVMTRRLSDTADNANASKGGLDATSRCPKWESPVSFDEPNLPPFPVGTLPDTVKDYVLGLAESTQTPVDMCACSVLAALALCVQGRYKIQGKPDWVEPLNLYVVSIAEPSERKSAVISAVANPITAYEAEENKRRAPLIEKSKMKLRVLEQEQKAMESKMAKKQDVKEEDFLNLASEIADFKVMQPLKLYVDDITTEKLSSSLSESGRTAILSSEGGIFDLLAGLYSKSVNIDVFLKAYSGDTIRVDRIGRPSESIKDPALTILLTVQPNVIAGMMSNGTFRGRGLTARFLYCIPRSLVGKRRFSTEPIPYEAKQRYREIIADMLDEEKDEPELITLSPEALTLLEDFSVSLEPKLRGEYADISDWAGKLVGNVLRLAGVLTRAGKPRLEGISFDDPQPLVTSAAIMQNAITLGSYFIQHAKAAYDLMGADDVTENAKYILNAVTKRRLEKFTRRDVMRLCRRFRTAGEVQPALDVLVDRGFLWEDVKAAEGFKKPKGADYLVNPMLYEPET